MYPLCDNNYSRRNIMKLAMQKRHFKPYKVHDMKPMGFLCKIGYVDINFGLKNSIFKKKKIFSPSSEEIIQETFYVTSLYPPFLYILSRLIFFFLRLLLSFQTLKQPSIFATVLEIMSIEIYLYSCLQVKKKYNIQYFFV